jgi:transcriptional regulator with XRE-family HTH domain
MIFVPTAALTKNGLRRSSRIPGAVARTSHADRPRALASGQAQPVRQPSPPPMPCAPNHPKDTGRARSRKNLSSLRKKFLTCGDLRAMLVTMQAISISISSGVYALTMQTGRPSKHPRTEFGSRLHSAREAAGLTQSQVAEKLGITQTAYALWERRTVALKPDQISKVAEVLNVPIDYLFGKDAKSGGRGGSISKLQKLLEAASTLSRSQQQRLIAVVEPFVIQHQNEH